MGEGEAVGDGEAVRSVVFSVLSGALEWVGGVAAVGSPVVFILSFALFSGIGYAILAVGGAFAGISPPSYLLEEAGIFISAVVWLIIGVILLLGSVRKPHMTVTIHGE